MDNAYDFVLADSGILSARQSTSDLEAGLFSLLIVLSAKDDAAFHRKVGLHTAQFEEGIRHGKRMTNDQ